MSQEKDIHTFQGKRKVGSTDICDFTDYQGIGRDPLYLRYENVRGLVKRVIGPQYAHFLAAPDYSESEDIINWYIDEWTDTPERLVELKGEKAAHYRRIKDETVAHYKAKLDGLSGEDLQVMRCALRYIDDDFIYCADDKVFLLAWGMTSDKGKHVSAGELVHGAPFIVRHTVTFLPGAHGTVTPKAGAVIELPEGSEITDRDIPEATPAEGYEFSGWQPQPLGMKVDQDMTFTAGYRELPVEPDEPDVPMPPPPPREAVCTFNAGTGGKIVGGSSVRKPLGSSLSPADIPAVKANKGYTFKGWDVNPAGMAVTGDATFNAVYERKLPWYKRLWLWLTGKGCLKWLLWLLLFLLLLALLLFFLKSCKGCAREVNGVVEQDKVVTADGDSIDDNGYVRPVDLDNGHLPDQGAIVAPIRDEDGSLPPIVREPGVPAVFANRLFLFIEDEETEVDQLAAAFKKAYPGDQYEIIGFDREVKSIVIQVPEDEKDEIRKTINQRIPDIPFLVFDEEVYEYKGHPSGSPTAEAGWHLDAVHAPQAWDITKGSNSVKVAVVDDGIQASHPMFKGRIVDAYNVFTQDNRLSLGEGHGTHTAGLAVGSLDYYNENGAAGIAPGCLLMPIQVIDNKLCPLSALVSGVMYALHKDADVVNISIGPSFEGLNRLPHAKQEEIAQRQFKSLEKLWNRVCKIAAAKNAILVFAAGNDDIISSIPPENRTSTAITVGAVDKDRCPTDFTNYGSCTDISAPGKDIFSSFPTSSFNFCDGTSMAAPIVTGTVALMKSLKKDLTVQEAYNVLYRTGSDVYGNMPPMVLADKALQAVGQGDFSAPARRDMPPVPGSAVIGSPGEAPPAAWHEAQPADEGVAVPVGEAVPAGPLPQDGSVSDYDAIRRMIEFYKKKIIELEKKLPENQ